MRLARRSCASEAAQHRDAADEGRLDARGIILGGTVIVNQGRILPPWQLIASVSVESLLRRNRTLAPHLLINNGRWLIRFSEYWY